MKLLIVEGNFTLRRVIRSVVAGLAEEVHECANGGDALAAYEAIRPDIVLADSESGDWDGIAVARQIRAAHPAARIIIVADYDDGAMRDAARNAGAMAYVLKEDLLAIGRLLRTPEA